MPDAALTPDQLEGLSADVRACVLLGPDGRLVAADSGHRREGERLAELTRALLERAEAPQVEVSTGAGIVYALRRNGWTLAAVAGRFALSSLMFFDMRKALEELEA
jgi:predicted regulator of Ras-like GTPase activity (Roadblock/LC7/MglB family)